MLWADSQWYFSCCHGYFSINRWPFIASHPPESSHSTADYVKKIGRDQIKQAKFTYFTPIFDQK